MNAHCECLRGSATECLRVQTRWDQIMRRNEGKLVCSCACHAVDPDELLNTIPAREYPEPRQFDPSPET